MREEQERNIKLKASIESKLIIYNEFIKLLSKTINENDVELARSGLESLSNVFKTINTTLTTTNQNNDNNNNNNDNNLDQYSFREQYERFEKIVSYPINELDRKATRPTTVSSQCNNTSRRNQQQQQAEEVDSLHYDFYLDSFIESTKYVD